MLKKVPMTDKVLKIGTRGSPLALKQAQMVEDALMAAHPSLTITRVIIKTSGDWKPEDGEKRLSEIEGGKGLFVREIERALMDCEIDCAVHSTKDMPSFLPQGLAMDHFLERADARDALISNKAKNLKDLPQGAVVGTSSTRRQSMLLNLRPDIKVVALRGNVARRIEKMEVGDVDATFLALAGLNRLGIKSDFIHPIEKGEMTPACGQGIVGLETRENDDVTRTLLDAIHHADTGLCAFAERRALQILDGSCHTPIGAHAQLISKNEMTFDIFVGSVDGTQVFKKQARTMFDNQKDIENFVVELASGLKQTLPPDIFK